MGNMSNLNLTQINPNTYKLPLSCAVQQPYVDERNLCSSTLDYFSKLEVYNALLMIECLGSSCIHKFILF